MPLLCLNIKINTVTCPGVWLCSKGEVIIKVQVLQQIQKTKRAYPRFPIAFVEKLSFQKIVIGGVESIANLLDNEEVQIEFIQWIALNSKVGVVLGKFNQHLGNLFDAFVIGPDGVRVVSKTDLLMRKSEYFPGIISPKINATFELEIESYKSTENLYRSMSPDDWHEPNLSRQRRVCHSHAGYPNCSICSIYALYDSCPKFGNYKSLQSLSDYSGRDYVEPMVHKECCCCCKYHALFY